MQCETNSFFFFTLLLGSPTGDFGAPLDTPGDFGTPLDAPRGKIGYTDMKRFILDYLWFEIIVK